jgi:DNA mismatch repair ATPase MutS
VVLECAKEQLHNLEKSGQTLAAPPVHNPEIGTKSKAKTILQADLFARQEPSDVEKRLAKLSLDNLSPLAALQALYDLKALLRE